MNGRTKAGSPRDKKLERFYQSVRDNVTEELYLNTDTTVAKLKNYASHKIEIAALERARPGTKARYNDELAQIGRHEMQFAVELAMSLAWTNLKLKSLLAAGYARSDLLTIQKLLVPPTELGRFGMLNEVLTLINEHIVTKRERAESPGNLPPPHQEKVTKKELSKNRAAKQKIVAFSNSLKKFEKLLSVDEDIRGFVKRAFYQAWGHKPGKYIPLDAQANLLLVRLSTLSFNFAQLLQHAPKRGRQVDKFTADDLGYAAIDSPSSRVSIELAWIWAGYMNEMPTRAKKVIRSKDNSSPRADGKLPQQEYGKFGQLLNAVLRPTLPKNKSVPESIIRHGIQAIENIWTKF